MNQIITNEQTGTVIMTRDEALAWQGEVGRAANRLRELLAEGYEREAWRGLGFLSWTECLRALADRHGFKERHVWELHAANLHEKLVTAQSAVGTIPEGQLRPLSKLSDPDDKREAWQTAVETAPNGKLTGAHVEKVVKELKRQKKAEAKAAVPPDLPKVDARYQLVWSDIALLAAHIETGSIDHIITDPPYPREYLPLYGELARLAAYALKPGGSLLVMAGQSYLPEIFNLMTPHLRYNWTVAYLTPGGQSPQIWDRKVNTFWKPVLWFTNGEYDGDWIGDVSKSNGNDKRFHHWGQSESGMADLIERFTYPGDVILDPFVGGGTTGVVAVPMNRIFIGADIEQAEVDKTAARLHMVANDAASKAGENGLA